MLLPLESSEFYHTTWYASCMSHSQTTTQLSVAHVGRTWEWGHVTCVTEPPHLCTMTYEGLVPSSSLPLAGGLILISCHRHLSHLECKMSNEIAQLEVATSSKCKIATSSLFWGLQFLCGRENSVHLIQCSVLLSTGLQQNLLTNKFRLFVILSDRKMWPAVLAQAWGQ